MMLIMLHWNVLNRPQSRLQSDSQLPNQHHSGPDPRTCTALFNPKTSSVIQKRHPYTRNLNSEASGDSKTRFYIVEML